MSAVLQWCCWRIFPELSQEISQIIISAFQTDFRNCKVRLLQIMNSLFYPVLIHIFHRRTPDHLLEKSAEILLIHPDQSCKVTYINFLFIVLLYVSQCCLDRLNSVVMILLRYLKQIIRRQNCQNPKQRWFDKQLSGDIIRNRCLLYTSSQEASTSGSSVISYFFRWKSLIVFFATTYK